MTAIADSNVSLHAMVQKKSAALATAQEAMECERDSINALMSWCVKNIQKWDFPQYDNLSYSVRKRDEALAAIDALKS